MRRKVIAALVVVLMVLGPLLLAGSGGRALANLVEAPLDPSDSLERQCIDNLKSPRQIKLDLIIVNKERKPTQNGFNLAVSWQADISLQTAYFGSSSPTLRVYEKMPNSNSYQELKGFSVKKSGTNSWQTEVSTRQHNGLTPKEGASIHYLAFPEINLEGEGTHKGCQKKSVLLIQSQPDTIKYSKDEMKKWFGNGDAYNIPEHVKGIRIDGIDLNNNDAMDQPPSITISKEKNENYSGPKVTFKLISAYAEGQSFNGVAVYLDRVWFVFEAIDPASEKVIENLYFLIPDIGYETGKHSSGYWNFYFVEKDELGAFKKGKTNTNQMLGVASVMGQDLETDVNHLAGMVHNYPVDGEDCLDSKVEQTGPHADRAKNNNAKNNNAKNNNFSVNVRESLYGFGKGDRRDLPAERNWGKEGPSALNSNCFNASETGWAQYWEIETFVAQSPFAGECSMGRLFLGGIADAFTNLVRCLIVELFIPIIGFFAGYIQDAAGISYHPTHTQTVLARAVYVLA